MPRISIWYAFAITYVIIINMKLIESTSLSDRIVEKTERKNIQRKLDLAYKSVSLKRFIAWYSFGVPFENNDTNDLYLPDYWAIFISSNETIVNSEYGTCYYFKDFICGQSSCTEDEDSSPSYSQNYSKLSISEATRLSTQGISIGEGAWKLNSSALYIKSCKFFSYSAGTPLPIGQIGLGLSGKAYQNFQTPNPPLFSIIFHSIISPEIIFGYNSSYVNDTRSGTTLSCDLDWKMQVHSMTIGDTIISSSRSTMIFDLQTSSITLPSSYFMSLKTYFLGLSSSIQCWNMSQTFTCFYCGESTVFPSLIFLLEDGTRFSLSRESYLLNLRGGCYSAQFFFENSTLSGADYIILGYEAMSQYYMVFQQLSKETAEITLYPHLIDNTPINESNLTWESNSFGSTKSIEPVTSTVIEHNPHTNNPKTETNTPQQTSPEASISSPADTVPVPDGENNGSDNTILYAVVGIILIVMTCMFIVLKFVVKKERLQGDKTAGSQRSTVEMNESSYFVTPTKNVQNDNHDDEDIADSG